MGEVVIELYWNHAPNTCRNFAELCRRAYFVNTKFHRIIKDFMIQGKLFIHLDYLLKVRFDLNMVVLGGDPTGTGRGGASIYGRTFSDEIHDELKHTGMVNDFVLGVLCAVILFIYLFRSWNSFNGQLRAKY